ncbi:MAG: AraC family transcriptional regulator [Spirochaetia bacterium]|jgi:AraC-like DNA-binding protein|nr:AraC family transcriptional regulator [Spirochaetia bacterium]
MKFNDVVFVYQMKDKKEKKWHGRLHHHNSKEYEIHYFIQGTGEFLNNKNIYRISPGSFFITSPECDHSIITDDNYKPLSYYAVLIELSSMDMEIEELIIHEMLIKQNYDIGTNYRFFFEELKEKGLSHNSNLQKSASHQLISFLYTLVEKRDFHFNESGSIHIEKALKIMQNNVTNDLSLEEITLKLNLSDSYFIRLFKRKMKITPMKYFTKLKIEAATYMLTNTNLKVHSIAEKLNFYSEFHFSRVFKQYTGFAPSVYRKNFVYNQTIQGKPSARQ